MTVPNSVLAIVPARSGSKGIYRKNVRLLGGKPLVEWTIEAAKESNAVSDIVVTTDDPLVMEISHIHGVQVLERPPELALDGTPGDDVVLHVLEQLSRGQNVVLLQPTSPLRTSRHIDEALALLEDVGTEAVFSVTLVHEPPELMYQIDPEGILQPRLPGLLPQRRQDFPPTVRLNGAIYAASRDSSVASSGFHGLRTKAYLMERLESLDIDVEEDLLAAESVLLSRADARS